MFEKSLLTVSNWQQLTHPDTRPDKGSGQPQQQTRIAGGKNKKNPQNIIKQKGKKKIKGRGHKILERDRRRQQNRNNRMS